MRNRVRVMCKPGSVGTWVGNHPGLPGPRNHLGTCLPGSGLVTPFR